jgi:hypothetical protein
MCAAVVVRNCVSGDQKMKATDNMVSKRAEFYLRGEEKE